jgi:hypothetical protein
MIIIAVYQLLFAVTAVELAAFCAASQFIAVICCNSCKGFLLLITALPSLSLSAVTAMKPFRCLYCVTVFHCPDFAEGFFSRSLLLWLFALTALSALRHSISPSFVVIPAEDLSS